MPVVVALRFKRWNLRRAHSCRGGLEYEKPEGKTLTIVVVAETTVCGIQLVPGTTRLWINMPRTAIATNQDCHQKEGRK
jgi:hypothetical protein